LKGTWLRPLINYMRNSENESDPISPSGPLFFRSIKMFNDQEFRFPSFSSVKHPFPLPLFRNYFNQTVIKGLVEVQFIPFYSTDFGSGSSSPTNLDLRFKTLCYYFSTAANYSYVSFSTMWQKPSLNLVRGRSCQINNQTVAECLIVNWLDCKFSRLLRNRMDFRLQIVQDFRS
jgi:hypothetical protein